MAEVLTDRPNTVGRDARLCFIPRHSGAGQNPDWLRYSSKIHDGNPSIFHPEWSEGSAEPGPEKQGSRADAWCDHATW